MSFECGIDTSCITLEVVDGALKATLVISSDDGNAAECRESGLYVPGGTLEDSGLPASPTDGQIAYFLAGATDTDAGVIWPFRFREDSPSSYQWDAFGATPLWHHINSPQAFDGSIPAGYQNIPGGTRGPHLVLPLEGDYDFQLDVMVDGALAGTNTSASLRYGGTAADFDDAVVNYGSRYISVSRRIRKLALPANTEVVVQYTKDDAARAQFAHRDLWVWPVRCT